MTWSSDSLHSLLPILQARLRGATLRGEPEARLAQKELACRILIALRQDRLEDVERLCSDLLAGEADQ